MRNEATAGRSACAATGGVVGGARLGGAGGQTALDSMCRSSEGKVPSGLMVDSGGGGPTGGGGGQTAVSAATADWSRCSPPLDRLPSRLALKLDCPRLPPEPGLLLAAVRSVRGRGSSDAGGVADGYVCANPVDNMRAGSAGYVGSFSRFGSSPLASALSSSGSIARTRGVSTMAPRATSAARVARAAVVARRCRYSTNALAACP